MTETNPESLRRYVVLAVLQYGEELKKANLEIERLRSALSKYICKDCNKQSTTNLLCAICKQYTCCYTGFGSRIVCKECRGNFKRNISCIKCNQYKGMFFHNGKDICVDCELRELEN